MKIWVYSFYFVQLKSIPPSFCKLVTFSFHNCKTQWADILVLLSQVCESFCSFQWALLRKMAWSSLKSLSIKPTILDILGKTEWTVLGPECLCFPNLYFESQLLSVLVFEKWGLWEVVKVLLGLGGGVMTLIKSSPPLSPHISSIF